LLTFVSETWVVLLFCLITHNFLFRQLVIWIIMALSKSTGKKLGKILLNKYLIVFLAYTVFVTFFDQHSLIYRWQTHRKITELEKEYHFYQGEIKSNNQKKFELQSSNANLEKFAREHYYMKKENEDIFIIKEWKIKNPPRSSLLLPVLFLF